MKYNVKMVIHCLCMLAQLLDPSKTIGHIRNAAGIQTYFMDATKGRTY